MPRFALATFLLLAAATASAQDPLPPLGAQACPDGRISFVFVDNNSIFDTSDPDLDERFRWAYSTANALHVRTRQWVIRRELLFHVGDCYDPFVLAESERILRSYPFLSQVDVYGLPQPDGSHHVIIDTHDDWSTRVDVRLRVDRTVRIDGVRLSELNFLGMGQAVGLFWHEREVTRDYGLSYWTPQIGRSRWDLNAAVGRTRAGTFFREQIAYPFVGELGHWTGRESFSRDEQYFDYIVTDDAGDDSPHVLRQLRDKRFEASVLRRFGERGTALLAGVGVSAHELTYPGPVLKAPRGDFDERVPADSVLAAPVDAQTTERNAFRFHALLGARTVRWIKLRGLDSMRGDEDVRLGFELGLDVGWAAHMLGDDDDVTLAGLLYGAVETGGSILIARARADALRIIGGSAAGSPWEDIWGEAELFGYLRSSRESRQTLLLRAAFAGGWQTRTPFQLTLGGERSLRGYSHERFPGGRRLVLTAEERLYLGWPWGDLLDTGLSVFADAGRIWHGDAPYGMDSGWQASVGAGLRFGFPAGSRTTYRIDMAWPVHDRTRLGDFRIRFSIGELIGIGSANGDLQLRRSRAEGVAADLFRFGSGPGS